MKKKKEEYMKKRLRGTGQIIQKGEGGCWYYSLSYLGRPIVKSTFLEATEDNYTKCEKRLDEIIEDIKKGTFRFADVFSKSSPEEKKIFADLEEAAYGPANKRLTVDVKDVTLAQITKDWGAKVLPDKAAQYRRELESHVEMYILPAFGEMSFDMITKHDVQEFVSNLNHVYPRHYNKLGQPLTPNTRKHILGTFHSIWDFGCTKNNWLLPDPTKDISPKAVKKRSKGVPFEDLRDPEFIRKNPNWAKTELEIPHARRVLRFAEWVKLQGELGWAKPIIKFMLLTGTIFSEVAALQWNLINDEANIIEIRQSYDDKTGMVEDELKTEARRRDIVITNAIRAVLDEVKGDKETSPNDFVFTSPGDFILNYDKLAGRWRAAVGRARLKPLTMYCTRHSFIGWILTIDVSIIQAVSLAGHATRKQIDVRYGKYVKALEKDRWEIAEFLGRDFYEPFGIQSANLTMVPAELAADKS